MPLPLATTTSEKQLRGRVPRVSRDEAVRARVRTPASSPEGAEALEAVLALNAAREAALARLLKPENDKARQLRRGFGELRANQKKPWLLGDSSG